MQLDRSAKLGTGSVPRLLLEFSLPAIVGMVAQGLYNFVDRMFVGKALDENGIAGVTVALPYMLVSMGLGMLVGFGAAALVSIRLGERKRDEAEQVLGSATALLVGASLALSGLGLLLLDPILKASGASQSILPYARDYLWIIVAGTVFQAVSFGLNAVVRAEGNPWTAMIAMLLSVLLNVLLAPLFLFVFQWGMQGAALATVLSQAAMAVWVLAYFLSRRSLLRLRRRNLRVHWPVCARILAIGSPPCLMQVVAAMLNSLLNHQLATYGGDRAISVMGIIYAIVMMIFMPIFGINQGMQPIVGYNYGALQYRRVTHALLLAMLAATAIALTGFTIAMLCPAPVARLFSRHDNQALVADAVHAMRICFVMVPVLGFQIVGAGYFLAVGKPKQGMLLSLSRQVLVLIPAVAVLPLFFGLNGVWAALPTADLTSAVLTGAWLLAELRHLDRRHMETNGVGTGVEVSTEGVA
jgi:putative MATE family efflux protein